MVSLVAAEYEDEHYGEGLNDGDQNATDNSDRIDEEYDSSEDEAVFGEDVDNDYSYADAISELTFHQSESESANVALKLGDRPRQHAEMSLYSSTATLDLQLGLLLLPAIIAWRRIILG
eukprot:TRINITY_DN15060_c0_g1_i2.p1 TRINITY_DN15060_c0_g1~~TRINITY_DN15060_c0_g1_i2.p1  ORF type:complete len:127 (-),score=29.55 TRINITY_DN15060_c0_g1_i2:167-523(-)